MCHRRKPFARTKTFAAAAIAAVRERTKLARGRLLLPGALFVTVQTQLLAPFMLVDFGLAAFFQ
jgi:hypothetical protein